MTKDFTGMLSSSAGQSHAIPLVTLPVLTITLYTTAFNVPRMTSKPVPTESNRYAALVKLSDTDSSADETEISKAEQGNGPPVPAESPHEGSRTSKEPVCEPSKGSAVAEPQKREGTRRGSQGAKEKGSTQQQMNP